MILRKNGADGLVALDDIVSTHTVSFLVLRIDEKGGFYVVISATQVW